jgi:hypothetical protein
VSKGSRLANKKTKNWVQQREQGITEVCPGLVHWTVRCATGQCPVHQWTSSQTLHLRENSESLRYNSPDCPVYTGLSGEPAEQRLLRANSHLQSHLMRARARRSQARAKWGTRHSTVHVRCATGHPGGPSNQSSNDRNPTAW